jgi:hypothetical protein
MAVHITNDPSALRVGYEYEKDGDVWIGHRAEAPDSREQIRQSDEWSPMVKRVMERFWAALDRQEKRPKSQDGSTNF